MNQLHKKLTARFNDEDIEWRPQMIDDANKWALIVPYITNRGVMDRLDEVFGPMGWSNEYEPAPNGDGVICGISAKEGNEWVTKWDGAENTDIESVKGGLSASMKRAAVQWGIGRYLYALPVTFAESISITKVEGPRWFKGQKKDRSFIWYKAPRLEEPSFEEQIGLTKTPEPVKKEPTKDKPTPDTKGEKLIEVNRKVIYQLYEQLKPKERNIFDNYMKLTKSKTVDELTLDELKRIVNSWTDDKDAMIAKMKTATDQEIEG